MGLPRKVAGRTDSGRGGTDLVTRVPEDCSYVGENGGGECPYEGYEARELGCRVCSWQRAEIAWRQIEFYGNIGFTISRANHMESEGALHESVHKSVAH